MYYNVRLFGIDEITQKAYKEWAKDHYKSFKFGADFDKIANSFSEEEILTIKNLFSENYDNLIFLGLPRAGTQRIASVLARTFDLPVFNPNALIEFPIATLVKQGIITGKKDYRSKNTDNNGVYSNSPAIFDNTYELNKTSAFTALKEGILANLNFVSYVPGGKIATAYNGTKEKPDLIGELRKKEDLKFVYIDFEDKQLFADIMYLNPNKSSNWKEKLNTLRKEGFYKYAIEQFNTRTKKLNNSKKPDDISIQFSTLKDGYTPDAMKMLLSLAQKLKER